MRQNFDFDGPIKLEIHATPLAQAQAAYDAHMARRVIYDPKLPCDHPHNEAARRWARDKHRLAMALEQAKSLQGSTVVNFAPKPAPRSHKRKKPASRLIENIVRAVARMNAAVPGTKEWVAAQKLAYHWKAMAEARAKEEGTTVEIPNIPKLRESA